MSKCKVCGADAGFMGVICSVCSTERARELHHYDAQATMPPKSDVDERSQPDSRTPEAFVAMSDGIDGNSAKIIDETGEIAPSSAIESSGFEQTDDRPTEYQVESLPSPSSSWFSELDGEFNGSNETNDRKTGIGADKVGCGLLLVLALIVGFGLWSLAYAACGLLALFFGFSECPQDLFARFF